MRAQGSNRLSHGIADCSIPVLEAYPKFETAGYGGALWIASGPTSWGKNPFPNSRLPPYSPVNPNNNPFRRDSVTGAITPLDS